MLDPLTINEDMPRLGELESAMCDVGFSCARCHCVVTFTVVELRTRHGSQRRASEIARRMKCESCGRKDLVATIRIC